MGLDIATAVVERAWWPVHTLPLLALATRVGSGGCTHLDGASVLETANAA